MADEDTISTEDLLEAFRRKKQGLQGKTPSEPVKPVPDAPSDALPEAEPSPDPETPSEPSQVEEPPAPPAPEAPAPRGPVPTAPKPSLEPAEESESVEDETSEEPPLPVQESAPEPPLEPEPEPEPEPSPSPLVAEPAAPIRPPQTPPQADPVVDTSHRPAAPRPTVSTLAPLDPSLGLADRIKADSNVTVPSGGLYRAIALAVAILGYLWLLFDRIQALTGGILHIGPIPIMVIALVLAAGGTLAYGSLWLLPKQRILGIQFASTQAEEWQVAQRRVKTWSLLRWIGLGIVGVSALAGVVLTVLASHHLRLTFGWIAFGLTAAGAVLTVLAMAFHQAAVRTYVQTTILWILEKTGGVTAESGGAGTLQATASSPDLANLLRSLDALLANVSDDALQGFMGTPEAKQYLELMDALED